MKPVSVGNAPVEAVYLSIRPPHSADHVAPDFVRPRSSHTCAVSWHTIVAVLNVFAGGTASAGMGTPSRAPFPSVVCMSVTAPRFDALGVTFTRGVFASTIHTTGPSA